MNKFIYFNNVSISVSYKDCDKIEIRNNKTNQTDKNKIKKTVSLTRKYLEYKSIIFSSQKYQSVIDTDISL